MPITQNSSGPQALGALPYEAPDVEFHPVTISEWPGGVDPGNVNDALDVLGSAKFHTRTHIFYLTVPAAADIIPQFDVPANATITYVAGKVDTGSVTVNLYKRNESTPDSGTTDVFSGALTFDTTWASKTITNAALTARQWLVPNVASIASGAPTKLWILVEYTVD